MLLTNGVIRGAYEHFASGPMSNRFASGPSKSHHGIHGSERSAAETIAFDFVVAASRRRLGFVLQPS